MEKNLLSLEKMIVPQNSKCFNIRVSEGIELLYIKKGAISFKCEASSRMAYADDVVLFNHKQVRSATALEDGVEYYAFSFSLSNFVGSKDDVAISLISGKIRFLNIIKDTNINHCLDCIIAEQSKIDNVSTFANEGYLKILFALLVRGYLKSSSQDSIATNNRFAVALSYINEHYTEDITTKKMADMMSYEESYFCHKFNVITGMSLINYVRKLRMERARDMLLENSGKDIKKIAHACGYSDTNYFTRCFKAYYGMTPTKMASLAHK